jgi:hypothetical protein
MELHKNAFDLSHLLINARRRFGVVSLLDDHPNSIFNCFVLGESLGKSGRIYDRVLLVSANLSDLQESALKLFWDFIVKIDHINLDSCTTDHESINEDKAIIALPQNFLQLHIFRLTEYQKLLFLENDTLSNELLNNVFDLPTPAGSTKIHNYAWRNGLKIPEEEIKEENGTYNGIIYTSVLLVEPMLADFQDMLDLIEQRIADGIEIGRGERDLITCYFKQEWHSLSMELNFRPNFVAYKNSKTFGGEAAEKKCIISHFEGPISPIDLYFFSDEFKAVSYALDNARRSLLDKIEHWPTLLSLAESQSPQEMFLGMHKEWLVFFEKILARINSELEAVLFQIGTPCRFRDPADIVAKYESELIQKGARQSFRIGAKNQGKFRTNDRASVLRLPVQSSKKS